MLIPLFESYQGLQKKKEKGMGRPPCCDKLGIKKGPWTPEEDIILVSYIQKHGPGNWRSVPTNTGLPRCSKSCRLRWTNYLRPGIKRGNFTPHEEGMIIHLQALLGNKWAAISSYLPQRTDNDIKNYWNTHLKKKMKRSQSILDPQTESNHQVNLKKSNDPHELSANELSLYPNSSKLYASSTENISRLLEGWMRSSSSSSSTSRIITTSNSNFFTENRNGKSLQNKEIHGNNIEMESGCINSSTDNVFESIPPFDHLMSWEKLPMEESNSSDSSKNAKLQSSDQIMKNPSAMSFLETWLLDEIAAVQVLEEAGLG